MHLIYVLIIALCLLVTEDMLVTMRHDIYFYVTYNLMVDTRTPYKIHKELDFQLC